MTQFEKAISGMKLRKKFWISGEYFHFRAGALNPDTYGSRIKRLASRNILKKDYTKFKCIQLHSREFHLKMKFYLKAPIKR